MRSVKSQIVKPINLWKLFLRDGINLYGAIWITNMINVLFWFIVTPTGPADTIKTIVTRCGCSNFIQYQQLTNAGVSCSMTAVLTTTMTLRVILGVRGSLAHGGTYTGMTSSHSHSQPTVSSRVNAQHAGNGHVPGRRSVADQIRSGGGPGQTFTIEEMRAKVERDWAVDGASEHDDADGKYAIDGDIDRASDVPPRGVYGDEKATLEDDGNSERRKNPGGIGVTVTIDRDFQ